MYAIIKTGGKQIKVQPDDEIFIEKILVEEGEKVIFDQVLATDKEIGSPFVKNVKVEGTVIKHGKDKKLRVIRYHPKKNVNKVYGHRQPYTKVKINTISTINKKTNDIKLELTTE